MSSITGCWRRAGFAERTAFTALLLIVLGCAAAPWYARWVSGTDPFRSDIMGSVLRDGRAQAVLAQNTAGLGLGATPIGPGFAGAYLLGADGQGRDVAARLLYGGRLSLLIAAGATVLTLVLGGVAGIAAGAAGGAVDAGLRWLLDLLWAFPVILLAIALSATLSAAGLVIGPIRVPADSPVLPAAILGMVFVPYVARPIRSEVMSLRQMLFVEAATSLGGSRLHVLRRHVVPSVLGTLLLFAPTVAAFCLLTEATLSVLGVGVQAPQASWGTLIADGQGLIYTRPVVAVAPGVAVVATVLALNVLADGLRPKRAQ